MNDFICSDLEKVRRARASAPASGWKRTVKVWAVGNPIEWHLESSLKDPETGYLVFDKNKDQMPKQDYYLIEFSLQDHSGLNLRFKSNPSNAFWVVLGDDKEPPPCPRESAHSE